MMKVVEMNGKLEISSSSYLIRVNLVKVVYSPRREGGSDSLRAKRQGILEYLVGRKVPETASQ